MRYTRFVLKNGLRVILVPIQEMESATTLVMVGAGSRYETRGNNGVSHFLEHMAFKGTKNRPTALEIASLIDGIGAESNAFTSKEYTGYYIKSATLHIPLALDVLSDMLSNLLLNEKEIDRERGVILEEINLYEDTPSRKIGDIFEQLLYDDTPMGWDIAGEKDVILKISRQDFMDYMKMFYSADNMTVVIAGKMDEEDIKKKIENSFGVLPTFSTQGFVKIKDEQDTSAVMIKYKKTEQAHFGLGFRTVGLLHEKDRYPLSVLSAILGGGMSSRLFHEIREKRGLAYYVRAYSENFIDLGYLATFAGVDPKRIDEAITVTIEEYKKILKGDSIAETELNKAKEYMKGHFILDLEDTRSVASYYATAELLENQLENPEEVTAKIDAVTLDEVYRVAKEYMTMDKMNLAVIGDFKEKERFEKLLKT